MNVLVAIVVLASEVRSQNFLKVRPWYVEAKSRCAFLREMPKASALK
ncbi:MAG: hypothetical protein MUC48_02490 [Leptolyngbya sp. Prado105]|nr:hypothetical protein [Leptolyngbya sp. Prado105]